MTLPPSIYQRAAMLNNRFDTDELNEGFALSELVRTSISNAGMDMVKVTEALHPKGHVDLGRVIAALDQLQQAKNTFVDAIILPHGPKTKASLAEMLRIEKESIPAETALEAGISCEGDM
jgi:hypothetical protein